MSAEDDVPEPPKPEGPQAPQELAWYFKPGAMFMTFLGVGPFMLPMIWFHPQYSRKTKITLTAAITVFFTLLLLMTGWALSKLWEYYKLLGSY